MIINAELEKSIVGCLLLDNSLIPSCSIKPECFSVAIYRKLYEEILTVYEQKGIADITVLKSTDIDSLVEIMNFVPTASNFNFYKKELLEIASKRDFISMLDKLKASAIHSDSNIEVLKTEALSKLNEIQVDDEAKKNPSLCSVLARATDILEQRQNNNDKILSWGLEWLDNKTGGVKAELTCIGARPSVGKSAFAIQTALTVAKQGKSVAMFSLEMTDTSIANRFIVNDAGIPKHLFDKKEKIPDEIWFKIGLSTARLSKLKLNLYDDKFYVEEILLACEEQRSKMGLDMVVLDYLQLCETRQRFNSTNDRVSYISRQIKKYQNKLGIPFIILSQLNRASVQKTLPMLSDLRDSGALEQDSNNVFFLHADANDPDSNPFDEYKEVKLIIAKQRDGENNTMHNFKFYGNTQRFYN